MWQLGMLLWFYSTVALLAFGIIYNFICNSVGCALTSLEQAYEAWVLWKTCRTRTGYLPTYRTSYGTSAYVSGEKLEPLSWDLRIQIAVDVARALEYLHDGEADFGL